MMRALSTLLCVSAGLVAGTINESDLIPSINVAGGYEYGHHLSTAATLFAVFTPSMLHGFSISSAQDIFPAQVPSCAAGYCDPSFFASGLLFANVAEYGPLGGLAYYTASISYQLNFASAARLKQTVYPTCTAYLYGNCVNWDYSTTVSQGNPVFTVTGTVDWTSQTGDAIHVSVLSTMVKGSWLYSTGYRNNSLEVNLSQVVAPEPATAPLVIASSLGLALWSLHQKRRGRQ